MCFHSTFSYFWKIWVFFFFFCFLPHKNAIKIPSCLSLHHQIILKFNIWRKPCIFIQYSFQVLSVLSSYVYNQKDTLHYFLWPFKMLANTESWSKWPRSHGWEMTGPYSESTSHLCPGMGQGKAGTAKPNIWLLADAHGLSCCQVAEDLVDGIKG